MTRRWLMVLCCALAGVAAAQDAPQGDHGGRHGGHGAGHGGLFVSPCGKPYRAGPGEPYPVTVWFAEADTNHDGFLERGEFRADADAFFKVLDANHDGVIDTDEVDAYERNMVPEILRSRPSTQAAEARIFLAQFGGGGGGGGHGGGRRGARSQTPSASSPPTGDPEMTGAAPYNLLAEPEPVTATDTELNQRITRAEFLAAADRRFDALDVRGTGRIALADLPRTAAQGGQRADGEPRRKES
jgi:EF hand